MKCKLFAASSFISAAQAAERGQSGSSPEAQLRYLWGREHEHFLHALIDRSQLKKLNFVSFILISFSKPKYLQRTGKNTRKFSLVEAALLILQLGFVGTSGLCFSSFGQWWDWGSPTHPRVSPSAAHAGPACAARGAKGMRSALQLLANDSIVNFKKDFWKFWYKNNVPHPALKTMTDSLSQENL